ncbi:MAG: helicase-related protein [Patescibacteria group bacterium]
MNNAQLPVWTVIPELIEAMRAKRNVVLTAPPGSGKTTQVPQAILDNDLVQGTIVVVQPRRVSCRAVGKRVAEERSTKIGDEVGYIVRYDGQTSPNTKILFVTDGVLLRFLENDPGLSWVGAVIFDEFHERRAITDVALGMLKSAQARRPSLRLVVMSATIESAEVAVYLNAVSLATEGKSYPVTVRYAEADSHDEAIAGVAPAVASLHASNVPGDILVFLAGKEEIRRAEKAVASLTLKGIVVLPLHGELPREKQDRVFEPARGRKVILATNVAETSVTIPGVSAVIDTGYEKHADFDPALGINRLALHRISKASAEQRAGRAGRECPGKCVRLWHQRSHDEMQERQPVEMRRTDLASVVLTLKYVGIIDPATFDYLAPPDAERLAAAEAYLVQLGAVDKERQLTNVGWRMLRLPLPPRYARMVVDSERSGCLKEVASIAALMSGRPILNDKSENKKTEHVKIRFARDDSSDFFSLLSIFRVSRMHNWSQEWCEKQGVNFDALQEAIRLRKKIIRIAFRRGSPQTSRAGNRAAIRRCIFTGLIDRVALQQGDHEYRLANWLACSLDRSTVVRGQILAAADVRLKRQGKETDEPMASLSFVTRIDEAMLGQVAPHLLETRRIPAALDRAGCELVIREVVTYQELVLESRETRVDIPDALQVVAEQKARAKLRAWHRVQVLPGIGRKEHVIWKGERIAVDAEDAGPHWASVYGEHSPKIVLREHIVDLVTLREEATLPSGIQEKVRKLSPALAKLIGHS